MVIGVYVYELSPTELQEGFRVQGLEVQLCELSVLGLLTYRL